MAKARGKTTASQAIQIFPLDVNQLQSEKKERASALLLRPCTASSNWGGFSSRPVVMLPNAKKQLKIELAIWTGEALIRPYLRGLGRCLE